ncbi:hypothetical protein [Edaphobacter modestus]|uniref:Uncharacterized protein n=1 Tax=Edaphobacter modestus TaxID=388466 RepID=A0A4Q7XZJ3_9BACT|nr:hypothetical protein [Edaphobacter modestus]RZU29820.1 hypothetical protein BDD14_6456 [Edaphobacter modestus]
MKIFAMHDGEGNITSIGMPPSGEANPPRLVAAEGQNVAEVEIPDFKYELTDPKKTPHSQELLDLKDGFRVRFGDGGPFLRKK